MDHPPTLLTLPAAVFHGGYDTLTFVPMIVFFGVLAFFGAKTVSFSGGYVTGLKGLLTALVMAPFFTVFFSLFAWLGAYIGIRLYGCFWPLELEYVPAEERAGPIQNTTDNSGAPPLRV